ncbi:hypothetical protein ASZ90_012300 [hydrocarbon metagenome]|jgi:hypothetical protein|uniref:Uncharacterized protein n=1 Tax=hydrocarbon metagenome TaxID=938273 RepID=A0A0W8FBL0_9ZZZZ|nr:hypothetical protein [Methanosaeta sp. UBA458]
MPKLDKSAIAQTFRFDCDRFLRFQLANEDEKDSLGIESETYKRPGIDLIKAAGRRWEADKYQDLVDTFPSNSIEYVLKPNEDMLVGRGLFDKIQNLFDILRRQNPPQAIVEAEFAVPSNITPGLEEAYRRYNLEEVRSRPDILWIRPARTSAPLIGRISPDLEYEVHIIDVKMAAEPSLRHFTEVTFYALALAAALREQGLSNRYAVSAEGFIWPGNHDANAFRNLVRDYRSKRDENPINKALLETLIPVPYEVYQVHVKQFFEERLLHVLSLEPLDAAWHVGPKCQLCDYVNYCKQEAESEDHLCRVPWLNKGQAELLRNNGIFATRDLADAIERNSEEWQSSINSSHQLRADAPALMARSKALLTGRIEAIRGRKCAIMPSWSNQNIFITIHFDPGTGITFAMGAARVYFPADRQQGDSPQTEEHVFIVDRVESMNPDTEKARLIEFVTLISRWLQEVSNENDNLLSNQRLSSHIFFWDKLEVRQLRRMLGRHMNDPSIIDLIELLVRLFPPDDVLPDPDLFRSQPGTVVKDVIRLLVGLPIPHDYTLFETANIFYPTQNASGENYRFQLPFGFITPMSDQIPFERAYELWQDRIFLRHYDSDYPNDSSRWRLFTRDEVYEGIRNATCIHLRALQQIVRRLRENYRDRLILRKSAFSASPPTQTRVPERARSLIAFERLNAACSELENRERRALPVDEREALFFSIRGLMLASGSPYDEIIVEIREAQPKYREAILIALSFSLMSRDARINEGDFLLALSNEDSDIELDVPWRIYLGYQFYEARQLLTERDLIAQWMIKAPIRDLLKVEIVKMEPMHDPPFLVVHPNHEGLFQFAQDQGLLDLNHPMVLDPLYQDYNSKRIKKVLQAVGGSPPPLRRRRRPL